MSDAVETKKVQFVGIKTKDGVYISDNVLGGPFNTYISQYKFDGIIGVPSYLKDWVLICDLPKKVEKRIPEKHTNTRYELQDGFPVSEATPKIIYDSWIGEDSVWYGVMSLYTRAYDIEPEYYAPVEFEINIIDSVENFKPTVLQYPIENTILDRVTTHPILLPMKPCELSTNQTYKIIREYIKKNIDTEQAHITSDYDFCFGVEKIIQLDELEPYTVDVNNINNWGRRKRKSKNETRYRKVRKVNIFDAAPRNYQQYPIVIPFKGNNYDDMINNINNYLLNLITKINEPVVDCPNCKGLGVIFTN
jgi:hypothetical protein